MIRTIIFDFDGVIAESVDIKTRAFIYLFKDYHKSIQDKVKKLHLNNGGMSRYKKFKIIYEKFLNKRLDKITSNRLGKDFSRFCYQGVIKAPLVKGAKQFLKKSYKKYNLYIVSGTPESEIKRIIKEKGLSRYFRSVYGSPKYKGELCKAIIRKDKILPREAVFIGDSVNDLKGAMEAGLYFVARVINRNNPLLRLRPKYKLKDLCNLKRVIIKLNRE
ncbi:MAG: HAD-IA family hydrolase [Patescibacteria group bacterium]